MKKSVKSLDKIEERIMRFGSILLTKRKHALGMLAYCRNTGDVRKSRIHIYRALISPSEYIYIYIYLCIYIFIYIDINIDIEIYRYR